VNDGPFPESEELLAGYRIVDVELPERAIEIAAKVSAAPAQGGVPIKQPIEVREVARLRSVLHVLYLIFNEASSVPRGGQERRRRVGVRCGLLRTTDDRTTTGMA